MTVLCWEVVAFDGFILGGRRAQALGPKYQNISEHSRNISEHSRNLQNILGTFQNIIRTKTGPGAR